MRKATIGARGTGIVVMLLLSSLAAKAAAGEAAVVEEAPPFRERWVVSLVMAAPTGGGYGVTRTVGESWRVGVAAGTPVMITGVGGTVDVVRGTRLGPVTLWLGAAVAGFASDMCSWGGCGDPVAYYGAGPQVGLELSTRFFGPTRLVAGLGAGVAVVIQGTDNLARYQPLGGLRVGVGW